MGVLARDSPTSYPESERGRGPARARNLCRSPNAGARSGPPPSYPEGGRGGARARDLAPRRGVGGRWGAATRSPALSPAPAPGGPESLGARQPSAQEAESRQLRSWTLVIACFFKGAPSRYFQQVEIHALGPCCSK